jgi:two-component system chemotaxis response regulator CheY
MNFQKSVLIVDDHADTALFLKASLTKEGFFAVVATSAADALKALEKEPMPDLILLDLSMPDIGGSEFMEILRVSPKYSKIKVLIVSGWENLAAKAREIGAHGFVQKPVTVSALVKEIDRISSTL